MPASHHPRHAYLVALIDTRTIPVITGIHIFSEEKPTVAGHLVPATLYDFSSPDGFSPAARELIAFLKRCHPSLYRFLSTRDLMLE